MTPGYIPIRGIRLQKDSSQAQGTCFDWYIHQSQVIANWQCILDNVLYLATLERAKLLGDCPDNQTAGAVSVAWCC